MNLGREPRQSTWSPSLAWGVDVGGAWRRSVAGEGMVEVSLDVTATLVVSQDLLGVAAVAVRDVGGTGLAPAVVFVQVRFDVDCELSGDRVEHAVDGEILLRLLLFSPFLLSLAPDLLVQDLAGARTLDAQAVLQRLRAMAGWADVTHDGLVLAADGLLILRHPQLSAAQLRDHPEWVLRGLPYLRLEEVMLRLQAIY